MHLWFVAKGSRACLVGSDTCTLRAQLRQSLTNTMHTLHVHGDWIQALCMPRSCTSETSAGWTWGFSPRRGPAGTLGTHEPDGQSPSRIMSELLAETVTGGLYRLPGDNWSSQPHVIMAPEQTPGLVQARACGAWCGHMVQHAFVGRDPAAAPIQYVYESLNL